MLYGAISATLRLRLDGGKGPICETSDVPARKMVLAEVEVGAKLRASSPDAYRTSLQERMSGLENREWCVTKLVLDGRTVPAEVSTRGSERIIVGVYEGLGIWVLP